MRNGHRTIMWNGRDRGASEMNHHQSHQSLVFTKETTNKMKRQPSEWEKIFSNESTDKGLISKIYKQIMQLNIKKKKTQSKNGQKT